MAADAAPRGAAAGRRPGRGVSLVQPTRILVVGGGGREHALAWKLGAEPGVNDVIVAPGSDGIALESRVRCLRSVDPLDGPSLVNAARMNAVELVVVGPEAPLAAGVTDELRDAGVAVFGPSAGAARIESSKAFCRDVAQRAGVPMAEGRAFADGRDPDASAFASRLVADGSGVVVKADGLAAGKGVVVCETADEAETALAALPGPVVVERRLPGREASVIALCDGREAIALPISRDHKRLRDGDEGPNTGGMGAYSPLGDLPDSVAGQIVEQFHRPVLAELARRGTPFRGALYAGLMLTPDGPRLLEFNARLGDPETQVMLPRVAVALGPLLLAAARGQLPANAPSVVPTFSGAAVGVVLATRGYPGAPSRHEAIEGLDEVTGGPALVFHSGTSRHQDGAWVTAGGRVLTVVGLGPTLETARGQAERAADGIAWEGMARRRDIASAPPIREAVA
jgi:phosphoribosylamine--glycine ligase